MAAVARFAWKWSVRLPDQIDDGFKAVAGPGNSILYRFLRVLAVSTPAILIFLVWMIFC